MAFFESISIAAQETIHSEVFAWAVSEKCKALNNEDKILFLSKVCKEEVLQKDSIIHVETEKDDIDIFIETDNYFIFIENKIKSTQHSNQLKKYDKLIEKTYKDKKIIKVYLSLFGEIVEKTNWRQTTHLNTYNFLQQLKKKDNNDTVILNDYLHFYQKLVTSTNDFLKNYKNYPNVFRLGSHKKFLKKKITFNSDREAFLCNNQLETILQKMFLKAVVLPKDVTDYQIGETRGVAYLNIFLSCFELNQKKFRIGLQYQGSKLKFIFQAFDYEKSKKEDLPKQVVKYFNENVILFKSERFNPPKTKAYISKSLFYGHGDEMNEETIGTIKTVIEVMKNRKIDEILKSLSDMKV